MRAVVNSLPHHLTFDQVKLGLPITAEWVGSAQVGKFLWIKFHPGLGLNPWSHESKKNLPPSIARTSSWSIPYSAELCKKNCIITTSKTSIFWSTSCYTAGSDKSDARERVPDWLLKTVAMVVRVHSRQVELRLTYWCSQSARIINFEATVCNNWTSCLN